MIDINDLQNAIRKNNSSYIESLLYKRTTCLSDILNEANTWPSLSLAALYGSYHCLKILIDYLSTHTDNHDSLIKHINFKNIYHKSPLHYAVENNHTLCIQLLLKEGADPNLFNDNGYAFDDTPIHIASGNNNLEILKLLIHYGGNFNITSKDGLTPFHVALIHNAVQCAEFLLSLGASVHDKTTDGFTSLHFAQFRLTNSTTDCSELVLKNDVDINAQATNGETPLFVAAHNCHAKGCTLLLDHGADINIPNNYNGNTPLHDVIDQLNLAWYNVELLTLDDVDCVDRYYDDVKHAYETICVLLDHHPDLEAKNHDGDTPLSLAAKKGVADIIEPLIQDRTASKAWLEKLELARESYKEDIPNDE